MDTGFAAALDEYSVADDSASIAAAFAYAERLSALAHLALAGLSDDDVFAADGAVSVSGWLRATVGMTPAAASAAMGKARLASLAPVLAAAWSSGALRGGQVDIIRANVRRAAEPLFAEHDAGLTPTLIGLSTPETAMVMRAWAAHANALVDTPVLEERDGVLHHNRLPDGTWRTDANLGAEAGAIIADALALACDRPDVPGDDARTLGQRHAEALIDICHTFVAHHATPTTGRRHHVHLNLTMSLDDWETGRRGAQLPGGAILGRTATERLICDGAIRRVVLNQMSELIDVGRAERLATAAQWAALTVRDGGCRHPGCDRPSSMCDAHHVIAFEDYGRTDLLNMVLKCRRHHMLSHRAGWSERLDADGTYHVTDPTGRTTTSHPPHHLTTLLDDLFAFT